MKVFTAAQMRAFDKSAIEEYGIPSIVLMENAALRVVEFLEMKFAPLREKRIVVLCGKGNNGGDGFAIARHLQSVCSQLIIIMAAESGDLKDDALLSYRMLTASKDPSGYVCGPPHITKLTGKNLVFDEVPWHTNLEADIYIDALLGTGFHGELNDERVSKGLFFFWEGDNRVRLSNGERFKRKGYRVAVDIPTTLNADNGDSSPEKKLFPPRKVAFDYTVTFGSPKRGMFLRDGVKVCGEIWVGDIGTNSELMFFTDTGCECITRYKASWLLPHRTQEAHKGDAGRVVLIGGSFGMSGAPTMAAKAVLKSGAGLCIAALPEKIISTFASAFPEATSHPLPCSTSGVLQENAADELSEIWKNAAAVAIGPGIGRDGSTLDFVRRVVRECPQPLIIDADALYALREIESDLQNRKAPTILTPHPGEMGELMEMKISEVNENRIETAIACAKKFNAIVVLKGARSIVALPEDGSTYINLTGNSGMATGGAGDVLTGTIAGLLAQTKDAQTATLLGVYLHGLAGDLAFETSGNGLIAGDIADHLPRALLQIAKPIEPPINSRLRKLE